MARVASVGNVAAAGFLTQDVQLGGTEFLTVIVQVGNAGNAAGAAGDAIVTVQQYIDPPTTGSPVLAPINIPALETSAAVLVGSTAWVWSRFRVAGTSRVQIQAKNNNVAGKPVEIDYDLG